MFNNYNMLGGGYDKYFSDNAELDEAVDKDFAEENNRLSGSEKSKIAVAGSVGGYAGYKLGKYGGAIKASINPMNEMLRKNPGLADKLKGANKAVRHDIYNKHIKITPQMGKTIRRGGKIGLLAGGIGAGALAYKKLKNRKEGLVMDERFFSAINAAKEYGGIDTPQYSFYSDECGNVSIYDKQFSKVYHVDDREFGQLKRGIAGYLGGAAIGGTVFGKSLTPRIGIPLLAAGAALGVATQQWDVVFLDQGEVMKLRRRGASREKILQKVMAQYPNCTGCKVFQYPDEKAEADFHYNRLSGNR